MATARQDARAEILKSLQSKFETRLGEKIATARCLSSSTESDGGGNNSAAAAKEQQDFLAKTFRDFAERGFDIVFRQELNQQAAAANKTTADQTAANLTVTDEDLEALDSATIDAVLRRKTYPPKCAGYLEKYLKAKVETAKHIRCDDVSSSDPAEDKLESVVESAKKDVHLSRTKALEELKAAQDLVRKSDNIAKAALQLTEQPSAFAAPSPAAAAVTNPSLSPNKV